MAHTAPQNDSGTWWYITEGKRRRMGGGKEGWNEERGRGRKRRGRRGKMRRRGQGGKDSGGGEGV